MPIWGWKALGSLLLLATLGAIYAVRLIRRRQDIIPYDAGLDTGERIAVRGLYKRSGVIAGEARNSLNPVFSISADAIHFRIFRASSWPFSEIGQIDVRKGVFSGATVLFLSSDNSKLLAVAVADMGAARSLLEKLPRSLPVSADAATLRDGSANAATTGLRRYSGPIR